jgi:integrase
MGGPVSDRNLAQRDFASICESAGVGSWHLHECRHTAATIMLANGVPIEAVSKVLGHADIRMTASTYAHLMPRHLEPPAAAIDGVLWRIEPTGASAR